jgi:sigma-B regulation protein RsbU (phosphoserine phosphatase)
MLLERGFSKLVRLTPIGRDARKAEAQEALAMQERLLPKETPQVPGFSIACAWEPSKDVSGDYFDVFALNDQKMAFCVADVSGKGMSAATLMSELHTAVHAHAPEAPTPAALCTKVNQTLCSKIAPGKYVTMFYGVLEPATGRLQYESAGHCLPLLVRANGGVEFPASFSGVLGLFSHWLYRDQDLQLNPGDTLLLITDGVIKAEGKRREEFGYQRLMSTVMSGRPQPAESLGRAILGAIAQFCNGKMQDEASMIVVNAD